jgi:hypothetical protein
MKNVIIFQDFVDTITYGRNYKIEELYKYFRAQIDNSLRFGWNPSDIVVVTNLDFSYKDVTIIKTNRLCRYNRYFNKQYGICELLEENLINDDFWFHDFDDWQINKFEFPKFDGVIGMSKYINDTQWNTGSIFIKKSSVNIWRLIVDFMDANKDLLKNHGDENIDNYDYSQYFNELSPFFSHLNTKYNVGVTGFQYRYDMAEKPVCILAFKPDDVVGYNLMLNNNLIDSELRDIFNKYNLIIKNE